MRNRLIVLSALLSVLVLLNCLILFTGVPPGHAQYPAMARTDREPGAKNQIPPSVVTRSIPIAGGMDPRFLMLDRDRDGLLSFDELPESLQAERDKWDVNGDGHIDPAEWNRYVDSVIRRSQPLVTYSPIRPQLPVEGQAMPEPRKQPQPQGEAQPGVSNGPGPKSLARPPFNDNSRRKPTTSTPSGKIPKNLPAWFKDYDIDGDGQVGLYEWQAKKDVVEEFKKYDLNGDGFITIEELVRSGQFASTINAPQTLHGLQGENGDFYFFEVTGAIRGTIWGTDVYTTDSMLAATAVHAGVLEIGETKLVKVTILPGQDQYEGSVRNGATSQAFGRFPRSYRIDPVK